MKTEETIAHKLAEWWNGLVASSQAVAVNFAPVAAPIPLHVRHDRPQNRATPRVINVLAYMDTRPVKPVATK